MTQTTTTLKGIAMNKIIKSLKNKNTNLKYLQDNLDYGSFREIINHLRTMDFDIWKNNIYYSLVEIQSKRWTDAQIHFNKYFDPELGRDWYEDIEIKLDEETDEENLDDDEYEDEYEEEQYPNNVMMIKQHIHPYYHAYIQKVRDWIGNDFESDQDFEDYNDY